MKRNALLILFNLIIRKLIELYLMYQLLSFFFLCPQKPTTLICRCPDLYLLYGVNVVLYHCSGTALLLVHALYSMLRTLPQDSVQNRLRFIVNAASFLLECRAPAKFYTSYGTVVS